MNSVFLFSARSLKLEHGEQHGEDEMPCQAASFASLTFHIQEFTLSSDSPFFPPFPPSREKLLFVYDALGMDSGAYLRKLHMKRLHIQPM